MFTGIIEEVGKVTHITQEGSNYHFNIQANFANELKVDQSVAHNGVCLTVVGCNENSYQVTAIKETLDKTNLGDWKVDTAINLERGMRLNAHLDGHIVQGHVDQTATCTSVKEEDGSWFFSFSYSPKQQNVTIEKGSITINGVSLTVVDSGLNNFSVAIIPYTYKHTNFNNLNEGDVVNLEFDVIGKYVKRLLEVQGK
ncbi:riboflavin synthase [Psychroflexus planctonicus]|uniref:Riboflavin synthase n=1 Tax=Psychroflexus planctonicus TaxID=1526575 RepID=A0ABQ1SBH5_9FLAO|nr:riboflavin synthase [Psychroflexus planctonicus]GGE25160.1 riboflavin synthase subunit alpha [Psychroflexus planctonicus]